MFGFWDRNMRQVSPKADQERPRICTSCSGNFFVKESSAHYPQPCNYCEYVSPKCVFKRFHSNCRPNSGSFRSSGVASVLQYDRPCEYGRHGCAFVAKSIQEYEEHLQTDCHFAKDKKEKEELRSQISQLYKLLNDIKQSTIAPVAEPVTPPRKQSFRKKKEERTFYVIAERSNKDSGYNISQWVVNYLKAHIPKVKFVETQEYKTPCILVIPAVTERGIQPEEIRKLVSQCQQEKNVSPTLIIKYLFGQAPLEAFPALVPGIPMFCLWGKEKGIEFNDPKNLEVVTQIEKNLFTSSTQ